MRKERKMLRFVPQKLRKRFANGNPRYTVNPRYEYIARAFYNVVLHISDQMLGKNEFSINISIAFIFQGY